MNLRENHGVIMSQFHKLERIGGDHRATISRRLDSIERVSQDVADMAKQSALQLSVIEDQVRRGNESVDVVQSAVIIVGSGVEQIHGSAESLRRSMSQFIHNLHADRHESDRAMSHLFRNETSAIRNELQRLRDDILGNLTGSQARLSHTSRAGATTMTEAESQILEFETRSQLVRRPGAIRDAFQWSTNLSRRFQNCECHTVPVFHSVSQGKLSFRAEHTSTHRPSCPFYSFGHRSWTYSLTVRLVPFLNKTVELTVGASLGAGIWTITRPLRLRSTVRRKTSPIFQMFDEYIDLCAVKRDTSLFSRILLSGVTLPTIFPCTRDVITIAIYKLDIRRVKRHLARIIREMQRLFAEGSASPTDIDENGNTLLMVRFYVLKLAEGPSVAVETDRTRVGNMPPYFAPRLEPRAPRPRY